MQALKHVLQSASRKIPEKTKSLLNSTNADGVHPVGLFLTNWSESEISLEVLQLMIDVGADFEYQSTFICKLCSIKLKIRDLQCLAKT